MNERLETGACFCGAITAELRGEPLSVVYDHDDDCRRAVGSPLTIWIGYPSGQVSFTGGAPKTFSKTPGVERSFCGDCGTTIAYRDAGIPGETHICIGFMDNPERFPPQGHAFWRLKLPWIEMTDSLPRIEGTSRERDPAIGDPVLRKCG
ncbi:GFA family protein [Pelagibius sp.]|uniref:GFA family protein n=1 Tax=Pelagibius sp. TaxID=1931238 RepID=UPI003BB0E8A1